MGTSHMGRRRIRVAIRRRRRMGTSHMGRRRGKDAIWDMTQWRRLFLGEREVI